MSRRRAGWCCFQGIENLDDVVNIWLFKLVILVMMLRWEYVNYKEDFESYFES